MLPQLLVQTDSSHDGVRGARCRHRLKSREVRHGVSFMPKRLSTSCVMCSTGTGAATANQATPNDRSSVVAVGEDEMPPIIPFTQAPPMAKLDKAISELYAACYVGLTVPAVMVPSRARVGVPVGVEAAVRECEVMRV